MTTSRRALLSASLAAPAIVRAQSLDPNRPVRWIVPFTPGGGSDIASRVITGFIAELPGAPRFVIDNRPGAGGNIGTAAIAQSPPDGHTVGILSVASHGINPTLYSHLPFDPVADFTPICLLNLQPVVIAVKADSPIRDLGGLLSHRGREMTFASAGNGLSGHAAGELFRLRSGLALVHVPYRGSSAAWTDLIGGRVDMIVDNIATAMPHAQAGTARILGLTSRDPMPGIGAPVIGSLLPGYVVDSWNCLGGPAGMPVPLVSRLAELVTTALRNPAMQARYAELRMVPPPDTTPAYAARYIREQIAMWAPVVRESGMRVD